MHYYGTYTIARAAGLKPKDAKIIAYSSQFVDDSDMTNSQMHKDGGLLYGVATAHHHFKAGTQYIIHKIKEKIMHKKIGNVEQRRVWVPFHFYPGNEGNTFSEKLICRKDSPLVNKMFDNHIENAKNFSYILQLIGIASHVYMDTFSHYGFSGKSSRNNKVKSDSFSFETDTDKEKHMKALSDFNKTYKGEYITENWRNKSRLVLWFSILARLRIPFLHKLIHGCICSLAEIASGALGHGAVGKFPDQPYLIWSFYYENKDKKSERNNSQTFLEGCEKLYLKLRKFSDSYYNSSQQTYSGFSQIKEHIKHILTFNKETDKRVKKWIEYIEGNKLFEVQENEFLNYDEKEWRLQKEKESFDNLKSSAEAINLDVYKFHQAADYHRHYTLKQLLPKYGIVVN